MKYLIIEGNLKTSVNDLENALFELLNYEPAIVTNGTKYRCFIFIYSDDEDVNNEFKFIISIIRTLVKHCSSFKFVVEEEIEGSTSSSTFSVYYYWNGKNLERCYKYYFSTPIVNVDYLLD